MIKFSGLDFIKINKAKLKRLICNLVEENGCNVERVEYNFIGADRMAEINKEFLDHDYPTDIITFDYTADKLISAEIFISIDVLKENAAKNNQSVENEVIRLVFHGVLHCLGYKDKTKADKEIMRQKEDESINMFHVKQTLDV
tara:strand:+ start:22898 stop:23326 length:429 start_codon:yes stop_codon:yes gene_type:complete